MQHESTATPDLLSLTIASILEALHIPVPDPNIEITSETGLDKEPLFPLVPEDKRLWLDWKPDPNWPPSPDNDEEMADNGELKAGLPKDFSGQGEDANEVDPHCAGLLQN